MTRFLSRLIKYAAREVRYARYCSTTASTSSSTASPSPSPKKPEHYDVVICGAGMVGLAAAAAISTDPATSSLRVLVVERGKPPSLETEPSLKKEYGLRTVALNPDTVRFMERTGAWDKVHRWGCIRQLRVWESTISDSMITFDGAEENDGIIARVVENDEIVRVLKQSVGEGVDFRFNANLEGVKLPPSVATLASVTVDGQEVTAKLVIGSDGAQSAVRNAMTNHGRSFTWEYDQQAVVANVDFDASLEVNDVGWQRFLSTGPVALLPLTLTKSNLIWSTTRDDARRLMRLPEEDFVQEVNDAFVTTKDETNAQFVDGVMRFVRSALGSSTPVQMLPPRVIAVSKRGSFPIAAAHAANYVAPRTVLVGDAAHRIHPMAGQGVNLGFGDVIELTRALSTAMETGGDIGETGHLYSYESARQRRNLMKMMAVDGLYRLYRTSFLPVALARAVGVNVTDSIQPVKSWIVGQASH